MFFPISQILLMIKIYHSVWDSKSGASYLINSPATLSLYWNWTYLTIISNKTCAQSVPHQINLMSHSCYEVDILFQFLDCNFQVNLITCFCSFYNPWKRQRTSGFLGFLNYPIIFCYNLSNELQEKIREDRSTKIWISP